MSKIDKLIAKYCPDGVEYKKCGEVFNLITDYVAAGSFADLAKKVKYNKEKDFAQLIRTTDLKSKFKGDNFIYVSEPAFNYLYRVNLDKESLILPNIGNCGEVYYVVPSDLPHPNCVLGPNAILVRSNGNNRFFYHLLQGVEFQKALKKITSPSGQTKFNKTDLKKISIPVPPLPIQEEIVKILDSFTALEAELEAELEVRMRQYEYYRNRLLSFEGKEVEWKTLGDVSVDFGRGKSKHRPRNDVKLYGGNTPFIQTGDIRNASKYIYNYDQTYSEFGVSQSKVWPKGTICITIAANIAETTILGFDSCFPDSVIGFVPNDSLTCSSYIYYILSIFKVKLQSLSKGSAQENINLSTFENFLFPFPSVSEQKRIVAILDKFEALVNDISEGLPAEIKARRQQYEHYRGQLLNFTPAS